MDRGSQAPVLNLSGAPLPTRGCSFLGWYGGVATGLPSLQFNPLSHPPPFFATQGGPNLLMRWQLRAPRGLSPPLCLGCVSLLVRMTSSTPTGLGLPLWGPARSSPFWGCNCDRFFLNLGEVFIKKLVGFALEFGSCYNLVNSIYII